MHAESVRTSPPSNCEWLLGHCVSGCGRPTTQSTSTGVWMCNNLDLFWGLAMWWTPRQHPRRPSYPWAVNQGADVQTGACGRVCPQSQIQPFLLACSFCMCVSCMYGTCMNVDNKSEHSECNSSMNPVCSCHVHSSLPRAGLRVELDFALLEERGTVVEVKRQHRNSIARTHWHPRTDKSSTRLNAFHTKQLFLARLVLSSSCLANTIRPN